MAAMASAFRFLRQPSSPNTPSRRISTRTRAVSRWEPRRAAIREGQQASKLERSKPAPLSVSRLRAVATALEGSKVIGPGVVARTCAELQRQFFDPPEVSHTSTRFRSGRP